MLAAVLPNTSILPPSTVVGQQPQQQQQQQQIQPQQQTQQQMSKNIPSLMSQKVSMPIMDDKDNYANQQGQNSNNIHFSNAATNNFFIPDLSKPPPGFMTGTGAGSAQMNSVAQISNLLQQQSAPFGQMNNNIPANQNLNNPPPNLSAGDILNNVSNLNVDLLNVNAALQLVQQQQLLAFENQSMLNNNDDECIPPPPSMHLEPEPEQIPSAAYYDLPAGLMVPLIRLEDYRYKPLNPEEIRLPPPTPQNERLTNALAAFYALPTHDRPRDKYVHDFIFTCFYISLIFATST